jgi:hypothetical protein
MLCPVRFTPQESPGTHCKGGCVEASSSLDGCEKSRLQRYLTFGPSSPQRVAIPTTLFLPKEGEGATV